MARKKREFEDDGRTVADMSEVGNMYGPSLYSRIEGLRSKRVPKEKAASPLSEEEQLTASEKRWFVLGALKASLLIGLVFIGGITLVVLLMVAMWTIF